MMPSPPSIEPTPTAASSDPNIDLGVLRSFVLALVGLGGLGLLVELTLLEHWTVTPQLAPLLTLTLVLAATLAVAVRPNRRTVRLFRGAVALAVGVGLVGVGFHFFDNWAFEREISPDAASPTLLLPVLRGATPLLAPGSLVHLGLVGLVFTYRHPALLPPTSPADAGDPHDTGATS